MEQQGLLIIAINPFVGPATPTMSFIGVAAMLRPEHVHPRGCSNTGRLLKKKESRCYKAFFRVVAASSATPWTTDRSTSEDVYVSDVRTVATMSAGCYDPRG